MRAGADFVVLRMSLGVVVSFFCSIFNRMFGARQFYVIAAPPAFRRRLVLARHARSRELGDPARGPFGRHLLFAGRVLIERATGFRVISAMAEQVTFVMVPPLFADLPRARHDLHRRRDADRRRRHGRDRRAHPGDDEAPADLRPDRGRRPKSTAKLSAFVVFILVGARVFSLTFYGVDGHRWVEELLVSLPGGQVGFLVFVNVFVFFLAFFLDFFEIAFIVIPLLGPAAEQLGIDLIWFGVMLGVNMQTSFMHPPFGFALFYLRSVAPREAYIDRVSGKRTEGVTTGQIYWGAVPFVLIQCIGVALVIAFPALVMHYKGGGTDDRSQQGQDRDSKCRTAAAARFRAAAKQSNQAEKKPRSDAPGLFASSGRDASAARAHADHEAVVGLFGDLPPQICVVAERRVRLS